MKITDKDRMDFLQKQNPLAGKWVARDSTTGRGFRVHQSRLEGVGTVRQAIDAAIRAQGKWKP